MSRSAPIRIIIGIGSISEIDEVGKDVQTQVELLECGHWFDKRFLSTPNIYEPIVIGINGRRCEACEKIKDLKWETLSYIGVTNIYGKKIFG